MTDRACTCTYGIRSLGRLYGINMGKGRVRLTTTPDCPEHDSCHGWTKDRRANRPAWSKPWCPKHGTRNCPMPKRENERAEG